MKKGNKSKERLFEMMGKLDSSFKKKLNEWYHDEYDEASLDNNEKEIMKKAKSFHSDTLKYMHTEIKKLRGLNWETLKNPINKLEKIYDEFEAKTEYFHYFTERPIEKTYNDLLDLKQKFDNILNEVNHDNGKSNTSKSGKSGLGESNLNKTKLNEQALSYNVEKDIITLIFRPDEIKLLRAAAEKDMDSFGQRNNTESPYHDPFSVLESDILIDTITNIMANRNAKISDETIKFLAYVYHRNA